ncbi:MAG: HlyD family efflux transporter periplasmic adaptor subunit [Defluviimonas sp.]|uniref:efflux RND transporter periplasmic adaptor subunit n=1 Tax=Albidovulum sp. TaxID=1872424 RepID=UPI001D6F65DC|nr:HlyD family efflux transporter periplasmic adaptor subunit [Paracoccaceae bacterium]MCC0065138.1 HlyD family efflux transporter periplasmic adaptor subunit [Defluviimonas sp.]
MRMFFRSLSGLFLAALALGLLALGAGMVRNAIVARNAAEGPARTAAERAASARVTAVTAATIAPVLTAYGQIVSRRSLELRAGAAGTVSALSANYADGAPVAAGELLVRIDPADAESAVDLARAGLAEAEVEAEKAAEAETLAGDDLAVAERQVALRQQALDRQRGIAGKGLGTAADLEAAELAHQSALQGAVSARQALASARANAKLAETARDRQRLAYADAERRLAETELRAPFAGLLSGTTAVAGSLVTKNEKLGVLVDPAALEVSFRISTAQFARLIDAQGALLPLAVRASLDVAGLDLVAEGRLSRVDAEVAEGSSGRMIFATLGPAPGFRPGDFVSLRIEEPALDDVALLPAAAVGADGAVLVLGPEDRLQAVPVTVLRRQDDDVIVGAGSLAGREVVVERTPILGAGIRVAPIRPSGGAGAEDAGADDGASMIDLAPERRAALISFVEKSATMPAAAKARVLAQLREGPVPAEVVSRIEARMGG